MMTTTVISKFAIRLYDGEIVLLKLWCRYSSKGLSVDVLPLSPLFMWSSPLNARRKDNPDKNRRYKPAHHHHQENDDDHQKISVEVLYFGSPCFGKFRFVESGYWGGWDLKNLRLFYSLWYWNSSFQENVQIVLIWFQKEDILFYKLLQRGEEIL